MGGQEIHQSTAEIQIDSTKVSNCKTGLKRSHFSKVGVSAGEKKREEKNLRDVQTDRKGHRKRGGGGKEEERERGREP